MANSKEATPIDNSALAPRIESTTISSSPSPLTASLPSTNLSSQTPSASIGEAPNVYVNECGKKAFESSSSLKRNSSVWEHFTPYDKTVKVKDATGKIVDVIQKRAHCKYCPRGKIGDFVVESRKGTSGMRRHMNENCRYFPKAVDKEQKLLGRDKSNSKASKLTTVSYSQVDYLAACVEMIVIDEFPFSFMEKIGFNRFCAKVCPLFNVPSRRKLCRSFLATYETQKLELKKILKQYRLSLTTDTWTSVQQVNYMVITSHFVDEDWKMDKRILSFSVIQNHQGSTIGKLIESCLVKWGIDKIMCITVDNVAANKSTLEWLVAKMNKSAFYQQVLSGKYIHVRCTAHITKVVVSHGLKRLEKSVLAIRNCVKFVRSSPKRLEMFKKAVEREKIGCKGLVCMDVQTRWNSTFFMLEAGLRFKQAFLVMAEDDEMNFGNYFKEPEEEYNDDGVPILGSGRRVRVGPPDEEDWLKAKVFVDFLRVFYEVTLRNSASLHPIVHIVFADVIDMENTIKKIIASDLTTSAETQRVLEEVASNMTSRWLKYFGSFGDLNNMLVIGLVLDARFKVKNVTHLYMEENLSGEEVTRRTNEIKALLMALCDEYVVHVDGGVYMKNEQSSSSSSTLTIRSTTARSNRLSNWKKLVQETDEAIVTHEVDQYLDSPLDPTEEEDQFDILGWWRINGFKYPVLAAIARDVLAIQTSTVASESCFSTGGRVISAFRSSLTPKSVEGLICLQNWMLGDDIADILTNVDEPSIENTEFYSEVEQELESSASSVSTKTKPSTVLRKGKSLPTEVINV